MSAENGERAVWGYHKQPVPGHEEWLFQIGLGGPCWFVILKRDGYTHVTIDPFGGVSARNAPPAVVRWLLDNHPARLVAQADRRRGQGFVGAQC